MAENFQTADFILNKKKIFVFSIAFFFLLWKFFSLVIDSPLVLPSPESVAADFFSLAVEKNFLKSLAFTFFRVFCAFFISSFLGILFGFLCTKFSVLKILFEIPLAFIRSVPLVSVILIVLFWLGSDSVPVFAAVLLSFPVMFTSAFSEAGVYIIHVQCMNKIGFVDSEDIVVTVYIPNAIVKIELNAVGGDCSISEISVNDSLPIGALPIPIRNGYNFDGWYTAASGGTKVTEETMVGGTVVLALITAPQVEQWLPSVNPAVVQVTATALSMTAVCAFFSIFSLYVLPHFVHLSVLLPSLVQEESTLSMTV